MRLPLVREVCACVRGLHVCTKLAVASSIAPNSQEENSKDPIAVGSRRHPGRDDINTFAHKCECISSVRQSGSTGSGEKAGLSDPALDGEFVVSAIASSSESFDAVRVTW